MITTTTTEEVESTLLAAERAIERAMTAMRNEHTHAGDSHFAGELRGAYRMLKEARACTRESRTRWLDALEVLAATTDQHES